MPFFDSKLFNGEVFQSYMDRIPNTRLSELINSRAIRQRPDLASAMSDQVGGNYITTPLLGLISGTIPTNYDGATDIASHSTKTFSHSRVVVGRSSAWTEKDFSYDITGGEDFMENVAQQVRSYWDEIDQETIVHILKGVFSMSDDEGAKFVAKHTLDVTALENSEGDMGKMDATTLNTAMQKACGDNKSRFSLAIMHSAVATNLENMKVLVYLKYNDANGMQRDLAIGTLNGRTVLVDDNMPVVETETQAETKGTYTITVTTNAESGDKIKIGGIEYTFGDTTSAAKKTIKVGTDETATATELVTVLKSQYAGTFSVASAAAVVTLTQLVGGTGDKPSYSKTSGTVVLTVANGTAGKPRITKNAYTTYIFGDGAIEYTNCGAKVPSEMDRDPKVNGGEDTLYSRQRKCFAPYGISFTKKNMVSLSPTNTELENGQNWELVNSGEVDKEYINDKAIPIARIISLG